MKIVFVIGAGSTPGAVFAGAARDAMWIVDKALAGPTGEPTEPYKGSQFTNFGVVAGGRILAVLNRNDDGRSYQYALAFTVPTVIGESGEFEQRMAELSSDGAERESDQSTSKYSIGLDGPSGRVVMDPRIQNGGVPPEPEPVPQ